MVSWNLSKRKGSSSWPVADNGGDPYTARSRRHMKVKRFGRRPAAWRKTSTKQQHAFYSELRASDLKVITFLLDGDISRILKASAASLMQLSLFLFLKLRLPSCEWDIMCDQM